MAFLTKDKVRDIVKNRPSGATPEGIVAALREQGHALEGHATATEDKRSLLQRAGDVVTAPVDLGAGLIQRGLSKVPGLEGFAEADLAQDVPQNLRDTGKAAKFGLPLLAGVATAGASLPVTAAASAIAGATGEALDNAVDEKDQTAAELITEPIKAGVIDAGIDAVSVGLGRLLKPLAKTLKSGAKKNVQQVLGATTKQNKATASKLAPEILERPAKDTFALSREGIEAKAKAAKQLAGEAIGDAGDVPGTSKLSDVISSLQQEKQKFIIGGKVIDERGVKVVDDMIATLAQYGDEGASINLGAEIENNLLRDVLRVFGRQVDSVGGFQKTLDDAAEVEIKKVAGGRIRNLLAEASPEIAKLNREFNFWSNLERVMKATNERTGSQSAGLVTNLATTAGAATGNGATNVAMRALTFRWLTQAVKSPAWKLTSARTKNRIADSIASGSFDAVLSILGREFKKGFDEFHEEASDLAQ